MAQGGRSPYGRYGIYGSLAYDFRPIGNERAGQYSTVKAPKPRKRARKRPVRSPAFAVSAVLTAVLLFTGLMAQSSLVALSDETVSVQRELDELLGEQTKLKIEHAAAFLPAETEQYAIDVLGMRKPGADQIYYIDTDVSLSGEAESEDESFAQWLLSTISEYFPG